MRAIEKVFSILIVFSLLKDCRITDVSIKNHCEKHHFKVLNKKKYDFYMGIFKGCIWGKKREEI